MALDAGPVAVKELISFGSTEFRLRFGGFLNQHGALAAGKSFTHTLAKMQLHLHNSGRCRRDLWARGHLFQPAPGIGSSLSLTQSSQHDGELPPQQTQGPLRQPVRPRDIDEERPDLVLALVDAIMDKQPLDSLEDVMRMTIQSILISWTQCRTALLTFAEQIDLELAAILQVDLGHLRSAALRLAQASAWPFLLEVHDQDLGPDDSLDHYEHWCASLLARPTSWQSSTLVPRAVSRDRIILHAFAGRRRIGDFQWYIDQLCSASSGFLLHVVSVDIVIDKKW